MSEEKFGVACSMSSLIARRKKGANSLGRVMASLSNKEERKRERGRATDRRLAASKFVLVMAIWKEEREKEGRKKKGKKRQLGKCESSYFPMPSILLISSISFLSIFLLWRPCPLLVFILGFV